MTDFTHVRDGDLATISTPLDLLGVNYYSRHCGDRANRLAVTTATAGSRQRGVAVAGQRARRLPKGELPVTAMGWEIHAEGLTSVLERVSTREYPAVPLYVTENGAAFADVRTADGLVRDPDRVSYLDGHLRACQAAIDLGVPLRGYFCWSLFDNFEWSWGYSRRFGLVYVDYETQTRTPKSSAYWYGDLIRGRLARMIEPRPTIETVAARAGVGRGTASRVVNGSSQVSPAARAAVLKAIDELGLRPEPGRTQSGHPADRLRGAGDLRAGRAALHRAVLRRHRPRHQLGHWPRRRCSCGCRWSRARPSAIAPTGS